MIRHAEAAAFPVGSLVVAVIEPPLLAFLVLLVGGTRLLLPFFLPASLAAIPVAPVAMATDPEHRAAANTPANPPTQELLAGPHPRPIGGRGPPRLVMAVSIPSTDDVGAFFRVGTKNPDRRLTAGVFPFRIRPHQAGPRKASPVMTAQPPAIGAHPKKSAALKLVIPCPLFPSAALNAGLFLSEAHGRMQGHGA